MTNWHRKDRGVWEVRGEMQHFVYSKVLCWVGLHRAAYIAASRGERSLYNRWSQTASRIRAEILNAGWTPNKQAFRQRYGHDALDASNLIIPFLGLVPRDDPRVRQNVDAIERELTDGPLVWRYLPGETDDGLEGQDEGAFTLLSFWLIGNLIYTGQTDRGLDYFHEVITKHTNHVGLLAEMFDTGSNRQLGKLSAGLLPHRPDSHGPEPLQFHRRHRHQAHQQSPVDGPSFQTGMLIGSQACCKTLAKIV